MQSRHRVRNLFFSGIVLERRVIEGDSPVREVEWTLERHPSTAGHVEPCGNLGGPPPKAKYYLVTDSGQVPRGKGEKHPDKGSEIDPETIHLQAVGALWSFGTTGDGVPFALWTGELLYVARLSVSGVEP